MSWTLCATLLFPLTRPALDPGPQLHLSSLIPNVTQLDSNTSFTRTTIAFKGTKHKLSRHTDTCTHKPTKPSQCWCNADYTPVSVVAIRVVSVTSGSQCVSMFLCFTQSILVSASSLRLYQLGAAVAPTYYLSLSTYSDSINIFLLQLDCLYILTNFFWTIMYSLTLFNSFCKCWMNLPQNWVIKSSHL